MKIACHFLMGGRIDLVIDDKETLMLNVIEQIASSRNYHPTQLCVVHCGTKYRVPPELPHATNNIALLEEHLRYKTLTLGEVVGYAEAVNFYITLNL